MDHFRRIDGELTCEGVSLRRVAEAHGTPTYVYSAATLTRHFRVFDAAWAGTDHLVCFAVKALGNLGVLALLAKLGSGFDIVSAGELRRVMLAGGDPHKVVFSGVGKTRAELAEALEAGILCFNVESLAELEMLDEVARAHGTRAPVSLRVNPDVDPKTHPYIATGLKTSKFGIAFGDALGAYARAAELPGLEVVGLDCHVGSQLTDAEPVAEALDRLLELVDTLAERGLALSHLDLGGGLGIRYRDEAPPSPAAYADALKRRLGDRALRVVLEPGRVIAGNAGVLLTRVVLEKWNGDKRFVVVDAAMNDALRPALYGAWHALEPVGPDRGAPTDADVVGPICETGDFLARHRALPPLEPGDLLAMRGAGAYGFSMASNYNSRRRAAEVLVVGDAAHVVRARESFEDLVRGERIPQGLEALADDPA